MRTALWAAFDQSCLLQHRHPVAFFQALEKQGLWRLLWPARLLIILCGLFVLPALLSLFDKLIARTTYPSGFFKKVPSKEENDV